MYPTLAVSHHAECPVTVNDHHADEVLKKKIFADFRVGYYVMMVGKICHVDGLDGFILLQSHGKYTVR